MSKRNRRPMPDFDSPPFPVNKKLNFDNIEDDNANELVNNLSLAARQHELDNIELKQLGSDEELEQFDKFSPCRTRSGLVYESGSKKYRFRTLSGASGQSGNGHLADCSENESEASAGDYTEDLPRPPPLNYYKPAISRFSKIREKPLFNELPSSPTSHMMVDHKSPTKEIIGKVSVAFINTKNLSFIPVNSRCSTQGLRAPSTPPPRPRTP